MRALLRVFVCCLIVTLPVMAQTPDGETPAEETICDPLKTATPGLYGLCVAYCEAYDGEILSPTGDLSALDVPSRKILENYNKRKQLGIRTCPVCKLKAAHAGRRHSWTLCKHQPPSRPTTTSVTPVSNPPLRS